jgi:hypothetical protein
VALEEARRSLDHQRDDLKAIRDRAVAVLGIAAVSASVVAGLGGSAPGRNISLWAYLAGACLAVLVGIALYALWPKELVFNQSASTIVSWVDGDADLTHTMVQRELAIRMHRQYLKNRNRLDDLTRALRCSIVLLALQLVLLLIDLWR